MATSKTISKRTWNSDQSWHHELTVNIDGHKLRVKIRRNAYDAQSWATVVRWNGEEWKQVCSRPIAECVCSVISYVDQSISHRSFGPDTASLLAEALEIIG